MTRFPVALACLIALPGAGVAARADFVPVSQSRLVKSTVTGTYTDALGVNYSPSSPAMQSAPDFSSFTGAVVSGFGLDPAVVGSDVSDANQTAQLGATIITASGIAHSSAARYTSVLSAPFRYDYNGTAESSFRYTFSISSPTTVSLVGAIHGDSSTPFDGSMAAMISLAAENGPVLASLSIPMMPEPLYNFDAPLSFAGTLPEGNYVLAADTHVASFVAAPPFAGDNEFKHGSFQFTFRQVPEPGMAGLALIWVFAVALRGRRPRPDIGC